MTDLLYVDASALVKLVVAEPGSEAMLRWFVESERVVTSRIGVVETRRAAGRRAPTLVGSTKSLSRSPSSNATRWSRIARRPSSRGPSGRWMRSISRRRSILAGRWMRL